jgi:hypothetical protein
LSKRIDLLAREMGGKGQQARLKRVGVLSKTDVNQAVRADIGDLSMSGWRRGNPHEITGRFDLEGDSAVVMSPSKRGRGPMRVLEQGRNQGNAGGMAGPGVSADGTTRRTKSGAVRKVRARQARRWNGTTRGKNTWTDATEIMVKKMPARYDAELARDIGKLIRGS